MLAAIQIIVLECHQTWWRWI